MIQGFINRNESPDLKEHWPGNKETFWRWVPTENGRGGPTNWRKPMLTWKEKFLPEDIVKKLKEGVPPDSETPCTPTWIQISLPAKNDLFIQAQAAYDLCDLDCLNQILLSLNLEAKAPAPEYRPENHGGKACRQCAKAKGADRETGKKNFRLTGATNWPTPNGWKRNNRCWTSKLPNWLTRKKN